jgi:hypothetical protein
MAHQASRCCFGFTPSVFDHRPAAPAKTEGDPTAALLFGFITYMFVYVSDPAA